MKELHESHLGTLRALEDAGYAFIVGSDGYELRHKGRVVFRRMMPMSINQTVPALEELMERAQEHRTGVKQPLLKIFKP